MKNILVLIVGFTLLWLILSQTLTPQVVLVAIGVALFLTLFYSHARYAKLGNIVLNWKTLWACIQYFFVFVFELVKANLDVALRVVRPSLPIRPGIVEVKTTLKSPLGRLVLANSITLTPGTLTVEIHGDSLFIHWIDVRSPDIEAATQEIVRTFEQYLEVIYG